MKSSHRQVRTSVNLSTIAVDLGFQSWNFILKLWLNQNRPWKNLLISEVALQYHCCFQPVTGLVNSSNLLKKRGLNYYLPNVAKECLSRLTFSTLLERNQEIREGAEGYDQVPLTHATKCLIQRWFDVHILKCREMGNVYPSRKICYENIKWGTFLGIYLFSMNYDTFSPIEVKF